MSSEIKTKTFAYKRSNFHTNGPKLSALLKSALAAGKHVKDRRESLAPENESPIWRVIGQVKPEQEFVFGVLMRYAPGTIAQFVVDDDTATTLKVEHLGAPETDGGKRRELLESLLYFGVLDNHIVIMQGGLRAKALEEHLRWLLHHTKVLVGTNTLTLVDQLPVKTREKMEARPVRRIHLGGELGVKMVSAAPTAEVSGSAPATGGNFFSVGGAPLHEPIFNALKQLIGPSNASKLQLDSLLGSNIEYALTIRYNRKTSDAGQSLMNTLSTALRHADDVDTKVELVGGGEISGDELRLTGHVRLETFNGIPPTEAVFEAMRAWLTERVVNSEVG